MPIPMTTSVKRRLKASLESCSKPRYPLSSTTSSAVSTPIPLTRAPLLQTTSYRRTTSSFKGERSCLFSHLPLELHVEIFSYCPPAYPQIDSPVPPLSLALVCKTWHYLITTSPRLWSSFEIILEGSGSSTASTKDAAMKRLLPLWLQRSRHHPLSFRIIHRHSGRLLADLQRSADLLAVLLPHALRWQNVQFVGPSGGWVHPVPVQFPEGSLPALRSLSLQLTDVGNAHFHRTALGIPWSQLTGLDLQVYQGHLHTLDDCFEILSAAQKLTWCTLNASCSFTLDRGEVKKLTMPSLTSLKLIMQSDDVAPSTHESLLNFLDLLSLTHLRTFSLEWLVNEDNGGVSDWQADEVARLSAFLRSSASALHAVCLAYVPLKDYEVMDVIVDLVNLDCLELQFSLAHQQRDPISEELLQFLVPRASASPAAATVRWYPPHNTSSSGGDRFPHLSTLRLRCSGKGINSATLLALLGERAASGLKVFELMTLKPLPKDVVERIGMLQSRGCSFTTSALNVR